MAPRSEDIPVSTLKILPPPGRSPAQNGHMWLKAKQKTDGAENLWRIHDGLYDFTEFLESHPGGPEWLELTKGTDITEAFEVHHISTLPEGMLKTYFIRNSKQKRNSPFTFKDDGFYRTLKREVRDVLKTLPKQSINTTAFFTDLLLAGTFTFSILANMYWNYWLAVIAGVFLGLLTIAAHNYFHQKDNYRMIYFSFSLLSIREWRVSHALSHHLHTNTIDDMEITAIEPIFYYLPQKKTTFGKYGPWLYFPLVWLTIFHSGFFKRVYNIIVKKDYSLIRWYDFVPFILPLVMYLMCDTALLPTLWMWNLIIAIGSFHLSAVGYNAAHHHPDIFHDGDAPRSDADYDWGISQLDSIMDRHEITGSHFLVLTNFGDHALHHFFPTMDHGMLELLYPTFKKVCEQFNVDLRFASQIELIKGSFKQLARTKPNPNPPNLFKKY